MPYDAMFTLKLSPTSLKPLSTSVSEPSSPDSYFGFTLIGHASLHIFFPGHALFHYKHITSLIVL